MKTKLYDYQEKIRDNIINSGDFSAGLFMKMGTGKTVTSLSIFEYLMQHNKCDKLLVVCLKCKIKDWENDINKEFDFSNGEAPFDYEVINFESIWRTKRADYFKKFVNDRTMIIIDESHKCVNSDTIIALKHKDTLIKTIAEMPNLKRQIKTFNVDTGETEYKELVSSFIERKKAKMIELTIHSDYKDTTLKCTIDHEIYTKNRGFVRADELNYDDDIVLDFDSKKCPICGREFLDNDVAYLNKNEGISYVNICSNKCTKTFFNYRRERQIGEKNSIHTEGTIEKMRQSLINNGKQFKGINASIRGGNGKLSPAEALVKDFMYEHGFVNRTGIYIPKNIREEYHTPWTYKPDYVHKGKKITIELDGSSHAGKKDEMLGTDKKTTVLNILGYSTHRFCNSYVLEQFDDFKEDICSLLED